MLCFSLNNFISNYKTVVGEDRNAMLGDIKLYTLIKARMLPGEGNKKL